MCALDTLQQKTNSLTHVVRHTFSVLAAFNLHPYNTGFINDVLNVVSALTNYLRCKRNHTTARTLLLSTCDKIHHHHHYYSACTMSVRSSACYQ